MAVKTFYHVNLAQFMDNLDVVRWLNGFEMLTLISNK